MSKFALALRSRTVWTVVILFVINGFAGVRESLPVGWLPWIDLLLTSLATYFRMNPSQRYN